LRNEDAKGYAKAANQGLNHSKADYVVLLNSDTIVSPQWLDRLVQCAEEDFQVGLVGPLSNTASWQSIPEQFDESGDWAKNPLPEGLAAADYGKMVAYYSGRVYPRIPFLNGFCLLTKRQVIGQIGYFDDQTFADGYGEENDYCLRASKAGWHLSVADDAYVYHAQSQSYSHERRKMLTERGNKALAIKHGQQIINKGVEVCRYERVLQGVRARTKVALRREELIEEGRKRWEGKRILFVMPITEPGGGGHVVIQEAHAMRKMGVDVRILNLEENRTIFEKGYPELEIPVHYVKAPTQVCDIILKFDASVATVYRTVGWMEFDGLDKIHPIRGYYIQDFEPSFFTERSQDYKTALESYICFPDLVRVTKTEWNRRIVRDQIGVDSIVVGPSVDIDVYRPRRRVDPDWPKRPLRIAAMVRPSTPRRRPELTMEVLRKIHRKSRGTVEVVLFGCRPEDPDFQSLPIDFPWRHAGILTQTQMANLLNEVDIFVDFSAFQAMGLTSMSAMACGVGVIVPAEGGSSSFASHESNAIVLDTNSQEVCLSGLDRLVNDEALRTRLQSQAMFDICNFIPESAAYKILEALFG